MRRHVYFYTHLDPSYPEVAEVLASDPAAWLPLPAEQHGDLWRVRLRADGALPVAAGHDADVRLGPVGEDAGSGILRRIAWQSATAERIVPVLEGDLELSSLNGYGCRLSLMGSYRPPLSVVGEAADRLYGHRVAEACVRRFVLDVAERLEAATLPV
jgi:hypothetical protein